jgi:hypothetical protein
VKSKFTKEQVEYIKEYYPFWGPAIVADKLGLSNRDITSKANRLKLKRLNRDIYLPDNQYKVNYSQFLDIKTPEVAYFLGLLWADGHLNKHAKRISIGMKDEDISEIFESLGSLGEFGSNSKIQKGRTNVMTTKYTNNIYIHNFLKENDYFVKSKASPTKILSKIPKHLHNYFWRGMSDGDGCFYFKKIKSNSYVRQYFLCGSFEQDWTDFEALLNSLNLTYYKIDRRESANGKGSVVRTCSVENIIKLGNYLYADMPLLGLQRKRLKFEEIKASFEKVTD